MGALETGGTGRAGSAVRVKGGRGRGEQMAGRRPVEPMDGGPHRGRYHSQQLVIAGVRNTRQSADLSNQRTRASTGAKTVISSDMRGACSGYCSVACSSG